MTNLLRSLAAAAALVPAVGCGAPTTYRPDGGAAPPLAVHPAVGKAEPGAVGFPPSSMVATNADGLFVNEAGTVAKPGDRLRHQTWAYYFPDRKLTGIRVESVSVEPPRNTNKVFVRLSAADRENLRAFAAAHREARYFVIRFESEPGEILLEFTMAELTDDGRLRIDRATTEAAHGLARRLVGQ